MAGLRSGIRYPVFYNMGKFSNDQRPKTVRAPFDVLMWDVNGTRSEMYLEPAGIGGSTDMAKIVNSATVADEMYRNDLGDSTDPIVMWEYEMGDGKDSWKGLHAFSFI